jgi:flagellar biosynthesis anti-sigma factor FlgM
MRIDLNPSAMTESARGSDAAGGAKPTELAKVTATAAEDVAHLSSGSESLQKLKMQLGALPDIRQERVEALKQSISGGTYKISPASIATAMLADAGRKVG